MFSTKLLRWFQSARRDLPWRKEPRDPYRVWVSEVMLQQTRVEVVIPYYRRFVRRFPTLRSLARASLDEVLAHWSGLGYYSRARNLHRAAQICGKALPRTFDELRELPGFGPYTAAAVASLAYGQDVALVDGNVARVLSRVFALDGDAREQSLQKATELLPSGRAGAFNEALMELGATVCSPRNPRCTECPVADACAGKGEPGRYPARKTRKDRPLLEWAVVALRRADGAVLLSRRPEAGLFAGLWDLPESPPDGVRVSGKIEPRGVVEQVLTHRLLRVSISAAEATGDPRAEGWRWVAPDGLAAMGLSSVARKSLAQAGVLTSKRL
jgi:A/G-specific adenine glycosylase